MSETTDFNIDVRDGGIRVVTQRTPQAIFYGANTGVTKTLTATNQASIIIDVREARQLALLIEIDAGATADVVSLFPVGSCSSEIPTAVTSDEWFALPAYDGAVTGAVPSGITQLSGVDQTLTPAFGQVTVRPMQLKFETATGASNETRLCVVLDVTWCRFFALLAADGSGAGTLADLRVQAVRVA